MSDVITLYQKEEEGSFMEEAGLEVNDNMDLLPNLF